ncbi:cytochrome c biogenesis protein ResB [Acidothermaceae bacterium B102]|nr:cytochrome c biogenesis protein ResB [Acidothermaceae bacterium B102]
MTELSERPDPTDTAARAALTTKPADTRRAAPARTPAQHVRSAWRRLTSMRTALQLLFLLALGAVPGSLLPQHGQQDGLVTSFMTHHTVLGPLFQRLSLFDVFAAPWFAAIYLLLFVSLIGCLMPRIRLHVKALRTPPPAPPRHFARLPRSTSWESVEAPDAVLATVRKSLRSRGWRVVEHPDGVSAERGYLRETGNLVFHVALLLLLVGVALGGLFGFKGEIIRTQDAPGWSNVPGQYDESSTGRAFRLSTMTPFTVTFQSFKAVYLPDGEPQSYDALVTYTSKPGGPVKTYDIRENHPLVIGGSILTGGTKVYLGGHGFAPHLVVKDPQGRVVKDVDQVFLPQETTNYLSEGYLKVTDGDDKKSWFALHGIFAPSIKTTKAGPTSTFPAARNPELLLNALSGDPSAASVYDVPSGMKQLLAADGSPSMGLKPGQSWKLKNGYTVTFVGVTEFANFQITDDPGKNLALVAAILIVLGLILSLRVRRRRFWVRARADTTGRTVVEAGGLARTDPEQFAEEFAALTERLQVATGRPHPNSEE